MRLEDGVLSGNPPANFAETLSLVLIGSDGTESAEIAFDAVFISTNDAPRLIVPLSDRYVLEDLDFDVVLQDAFEDPDGDDLTLTATQLDGSALPDWLFYDPADNRLTGRPPQDFVGTVGILLTASDGQYSVSNGFDFTVVNLNDAPVAANPMADLVVEEDSFIDYELPFAETFLDIDGDELSYTVISADGSALPEWLSFANGTLSGQPPLNSNDDVELTVYATDGFETVETSFTIRLTPVADLPIANDDYGLVMNAGSALVFTEDDFLANDFDPDGGELSLVSTNAPENGELIRDDLGNFVYTPNDSFAGVDSFTYSVENDTGSAEATVNIFVQDNYLSYDVQGTAGNDFIFGDIFSRNSIYGGDGNDLLFGGLRSDQLAGGAGDDLLMGLSGRDTLDGGAGNDVLFGGNGRDMISGGTGDDILFGGRGRDIFEFAQGDGADIIADFNPGRARRNFFIAGDRIEIDYAGIDNFDDLMSFASQDGRDTVFDFGNGDILVLSRTRLASLDDDAFTFV